jgi:hypothetical protein
MAGEGRSMRSGGFPCRLAGCDRAFQVADQTSMDSLRAAREEERPYLPHQRIKVPKTEQPR